MREDPGLLPGLATLLLLGLLSGALLGATTRHRETLRFQWTLFGAALTIRFAVSVGIYVMGLVHLTGDEDASGWVAGIGLYERWKQQEIPLWGLPLEMYVQALTRGNGYGVALGGLFFVTGSPYRLVAAALNGCCGALAAVFAYRAAATLFSSEVGRQAGWWCCLFPSLVLWSSLTIKEPVILFLEAAAVYGCLRLQESSKPSVGHILLVANAVVALHVFRFYAAYIVLFSVVGSLLAGLFLRRGRARTQGLSAAAILALVMATGVLRKTSPVLGYLTPRTAEAVRSRLAGDQRSPGSRTGVRPRRRNLSSFVLGTLAGGAHLLLAPFPWQFGGSSLRMRATLPEMIYWWWLLAIGVLPGAVYCARQRLPDVLVLLLFILGFGLLYSAVFGNVGLVFRQRAQLLPWLFAFGAMGLQRRRERLRGEAA